jgi:hypothetical protein
VILAAVLVLVARPMLVWTTLGTLVSVASAQATEDTSCAYQATQRLAEVQTPAIDEASALAASHQRPGVYWTLNDAGNPPVIFAVDEGGRAFGTFEVDGATNVDWESLQIGPGPDGRDWVYIADAGDNQLVRSDAVLYRVPEPDVAPASPDQPAALTAPAEAFRFVYPDGPHDVEALLVHPTTGEIVLISKEQSGHSHVYRMPLPLDATRVVQIDLVAELDVRAFVRSSRLVTDAAMAPDGHHVALRTYTSALEYLVPEGATLADIWSSTPHVFALDDGPQGEGLAYRLDGTAILTTGEGTPAVLYVTQRTC